jgi:hypothetical protein
VLIGKVKNNFTLITTILPFKTSLNKVYMLLILSIIIMKKQLIYFILLSCLGFTACKKDVEQQVVVSDCLNKTVDNPVLVADIEGKILGEWQLTELIGNMPNPKVPDLKVIFKPSPGFQNNKDVADIYENGKLTNTMYFSLKQKNGNSYQSVEIVSDSESFQNGDYNFLRGTIRICDNQMMIDNGIAFDAPGYVFTKVSVAK